MMDKLTIEIGEIDFLEEESVVLKGGKKIKSNVLLKCIGIKTDSTIIPTIFGENSIIDGFWINKDPNLFTYSDGESFSNALTNVKSLLCGSYLFFVQAFTPAYIYYRKNPEKMKSLILKLTNTEFNNNKISILFTEMWDYIEEAKKNNQIHVLEECSIERFLTETEIEWYSYIEKFSINRKADMDSYWSIIQNGIHYLNDSKIDAIQEEREYYPQIGVNSVQVTARKKFYFCLGKV